jgi:hypothetical protein
VGWGQGRIKTTACGYLGGCTLSERLQLFVQDNTGKHARGVDSIIQQITKTFSMSQHIHTPISDHMRKLILINYAVTVGIELIEPRQNVCVLEGLSHNHKRAPDFVAGCTIKNKISMPILFYLSMKLIIVTAAVIHARKRQMKIRCDFICLDEIVQLQIFPNFNSTHQFRPPLLSVSKSRKISDILPLKLAGLTDEKSPCTSIPVASFRRLCSRACLMQHFARSLSFSSRIPCHSRT